MKELENLRQSQIAAREKAREEAAAAEAAAGKGGKKSKQGKRDVSSPTQKDLELEDQETQAKIAALEADAGLSGVAQFKSQDDDPAKNFDFFEF